MPDLFPIDAAQPLSGAYAFNEPGESILLYDGPIGGLGVTQAAGTVRLLCEPELRIDWYIREGVPPGLIGPEPVTLRLRRPAGEVTVPGLVNGVEGGWSNGAVLGNQDVPLRRIVAHWFNLPPVGGSTRLTATTADGNQAWWSGRWAVEINGWSVTLDGRPDLRRRWTQLCERHLYAMTHVMEIRRADGATFNPGEAEPFLTALHVGVSFALGRWAAPMVPVGEDSSGQFVWEKWLASHCDPARDTPPGWWYHLESEALAELLERTSEAFVDPVRRTSLRLQMIHAIMATNDRGFVEQRITAAAAGLEHLMWQELVLAGRLTERQYIGRHPYQGRRLSAHDLLRKVLGIARIPTSIDPGLQPIMADFAIKERTRQGRTLDGADIVTQIRNRLVHPKGTLGNVYQLDGLLGEVWLLARHYLVLLILHSLGYKASYRDLRKTTGWTGDVGRVPWVRPALRS